jgi:hypothetical protein
MLFGSLLLTVLTGILSVKALSGCGFKASDNAAGMS